jgi:hypothetical protein
MGMDRDVQSYRVVLRTGGTVRAFGSIGESTVTARTLDPFLSRLLLAGVRTGELLLVDEATGRVAVRLRRRRS